MKIIVLHGDHIIKSYERLQKFVKVGRSRGWQIIKISEKGQNIQEALISDSLFENNKLVVIENANFINKSLSKWLKQKKDSINATVIIYHQGNIGKRTINLLPNVEKEENYKLPKLIWSFLDSFYPNNAKTSLLLFHDIVKHEPVEFIFALIAKLMRDLYWVKNDIKSLNYPSWRLGKLRKQASFFPNGLIEEIIKDLVDVDMNTKSSNANLIDSIDFLILSKLK